MEHRCGRRREIGTPIRVRRPDGLAASGRLRNTSLSGALVESDLSVKVLSYIEIELSVRQWNPIFVEAQVVRSTAGGVFAIEWSELAPAIVQRLVIGQEHAGAVSPG
jgi:hypothetical protein